MINIIMIISLCFTIVSFFAVLVEAHNTRTPQTQWLSIILKIIFWVSLAVAISSLALSIGGFSK